MYFCGGIAKAEDFRFRFSLIKNFAAISRASKAPQALQKGKLFGIRVYQDGVDVTPKPLSPMLLEEDPEKQMNIFDMVSVSSSKVDQSAFKTLSTSKFHTEMLKQTARSRGTLLRSVIETDEDFGIEAENKFSESMSVISGM